MPSTPIVLTFRNLDVYVVSVTVSIEMNSKEISDHHKELLNVVIPEHITDDELSKLAHNVIPAEHARPFVLQYLQLSDNEYSNIAHATNSIHHDTLVECFKRWRNKQSKNGVNLRRELLQLLEYARKEHGWYSNISYAFVEDTCSDETPNAYQDTVSPSSRYSPYSLRSYFLPVYVLSPSHLS